MKQQWILIFALLFALVIAVFSVVNVDPVPVDYLFGTAQFPLIMVILGSALAGGFVVGLFGTIRMIGQNRQIRALKKELEAVKNGSTAPAEYPPTSAAAAPNQTAMSAAASPEGSASGEHPSGERSFTGDSSREQQIQDEGSD